MTLVPIAPTLAENAAFAHCPDCMAILPMTLEYYGKIGYQPPWIGYFIGDGERFVGTGAFKGAPREGRVEIAYGTFEAYRKQGYGTCICRLLVEKSLETDPSVVITARTLPERNYSAMLLEKNGFILLGTVEDEEDGEVWEWQYLRYPRLPNDKPLTLESERLQLRPTDQQDAAFIRELLNTPTFLHFIGDRKVRTLAEAETYIEERISGQMRRLGYSNYTIIRKADGAKLGTCGLYARPGVPGIDIGYALLPDFEGKGYASEAAAKMLDTAFRVFHLPVVQAYTTRANTASQRVLKKIGLRQAGLEYLPDDPEELILYKLAADEYHPATPE